MTQYSDWVQSNWFELGILFLLFATLVTVFWFARNILKTFRASQEQVGALLRLSFSDVVPAQAPAAEVEVSVPILSEPSPRGPNRLVRWFQAPMGSRDRSFAPWRKVFRWLQAPAGS
jgi:hypothetical protein